MMRTMGLMLVAALLIVAVPAYSSTATQVYRCEMEDDATEKEVVAAASKWLKAAKTMEGGQNLEAFVYFPMANGDIGEVDILFVITSPSFAEWGLFWDGYDGSAAAKVDMENRANAICPGSDLWESVKIE